MADSPAIPPDAQNAFQTGSAFRYIDEDHCPPGEMLNELHEVLSAHPRVENVAIGFDRADCMVYVQALILTEGVPDIKDRFFGLVCVAATMEALHRKYIKKAGDN